MAGTPLDLFIKRRDSAGSFVFGNAFDSPHGKEQVPKPYKRFLVNYCAYPIVECIQVEAAQEYASRTDLVEHAPAFFPRRVQCHDDRSPSLNSRDSFVSFRQSAVPRRSSNLAYLFGSSLRLELFNRLDNVGAEKHVHQPLPEFLLRL